MTTLPLAMRMLRRNWTGGELRVLLLALVIAVASVTTVGFFADRVQAALDRQANELLGGDLVVVSDHALAPAFIEAAARERLDIATTRTFPSMVAAQGGVNLAEIKAASSRFPLRGRLRVKTDPSGPEREVEGGPKAGTHGSVALVGRLGTKVGDVLRSGARGSGRCDHHAQADGVLDFAGIAPRVLMNGTVSTRRGWCGRQPP
jgi:putative ABC transport system permease protein